MTASWSGITTWKGQRKVGEYAVRKMGYDLNEGRIDRSDHPFTTSIGRGDVRFTMRYLPSISIAHGSPC